MSDISAEIQPAFMHWESGWSLTVRDIRMDWMVWMDWMGHWWDGGRDGQTLAGSGTGAPPSAPEQERHHWLLRGGGRWVAVSVANCFVGERCADYLCQRSKRIQIECTQIGTNT